MVDRTMSCEVMAETLIVVHGPIAPDPGEWMAFANRSRARDFHGMLVIVDDAFPGPSAAQRSEIAASNKLRGVYPRVAVVTPSLVHRGMVTVIGWLQRNNLSSFHPDRLEQALAFTGAPQAAWPGIVERVHALATGLNAPWIVQHIRLASRAA
jgi:hypothetical protein